VVAEVLLIAIVVTTSIGIWYWMGSFTQVPVNPNNYISVTVTNCNGTHVLVRNVGVEEANKQATIFKKDIGIVGYIDLNATNRRLTSGNSSYVEIVPTGGAVLPFSGTFLITDRNYQEYPFVC